MAGEAPGTPARAIATTAAVAEAAPGTPARAIATTAAVAEEAPGTPARAIATTAAVGAGERRETAIGTREAATAAETRRAAW